MLIIRFTVLFLVLLYPAIVAYSAQDIPRSQLHNSDLPMLSEPAGQEPDSTQSTSDSTDVDDEQLDQEIESLLSDSTDAEEAIDELDEEDDNWSYSAYIDAKTKSVSKGITVSNGKPLMDFGSDISYKDLCLSAELSKLAAENVLSSYTLGLDYSYSISDWFDISAAGSQFKYFNDTTNPNAENHNSISLNCDFTVYDIMLDLGYQRIFGGIPVNYISATVAWFKSFGKLKLSLMGDVTSSDYSKTAKAKINSTKKLVSSRSMVYTGIAGIKYELPKGFDVGATATLTSDSKGKLTPLFKLKIGYDLDF